MAEAMLSGLAVITTGWGGQLDFCTNETAWLVDYSFKAVKTHFGLFDSVWAVPNIEQLAMTMRGVYDMPADLRHERAALGRALLLEKFRWSDVATRLVDSVRSWAQSSTIPEPHTGWVSTWNTSCGIASYSAYLVGNMPGEVTLFAARTEQPAQLDGPEVVRCWTAGEADSLDELSDSIEERQIDALVVQFNYSFFNIETFGHFLKGQLDTGRRVVLMMHSTSDPVHVMPHQRLEKIRTSLARCHRILVHGPGDLNRLKELGLIENVTLFPHGVREYSPSLTVRPPPLISPPPAPDDCFTLASYGFFLPHKGLLELIEAVSLLNKSGWQK
jgi:glycosyltransferase involved in cell wall biosynthesis